MLMPRRLLFGCAAMLAALGLGRHGRRQAAGPRHPGRHRERLDPADIRGQQDQEIGTNVYERLVSMKFNPKPDGTLMADPVEVVPELAESWTAIEGPVITCLTTLEQVIGNLGGGLVEMGVLEHPLRLVWRRTTRAAFRPPPPPVQTPRLGRGRIASGDRSWPWATAARLRDAVDSQPGSASSTGSPRWRSGRTQATAVSPTSFPSVRPARPAASRMSAMA